MNTLVGVIAFFIAVGVTFEFWEHYGSYPVICWGVTGTIPLAFVLIGFGLIEDIPIAEGIMRRSKKREDDY